MVRTPIATTLFALLASGCGLVGGGTVAPTPWELAATSPDETQLLVTTNFGGVASGCSRFEGWEITETVDRVEILAMLWTKDNPGGCTDDGARSTVAVQLDEPLGERALVGCVAEDCSHVDALAPGFHGGPASVAANDTHLALTNGVNLQLFDQEGALLSTDSAVSLQTLHPVGDVFVSNNGLTLVAYDQRDAETRWAVPGQMQATDGDNLYVCIEDENLGWISRIRADTGDSQWSVKGPCDFVVPFDDTIITLGTDPAVDGGSELVVVDRTTGTEISRRPFDDGSDDQVNGVRGVTRVGNHAVAFGWQSDTIVLDAAGQEVTRRSDRLGVPVGAAEGLLITALEQQVLATDPLTGDVLWSLDRRHAGGRSGTFIVVDGTLWLPDPGLVTRIDARTGEVAWSIPVPAGAGMSLAVTDDAVYATAPLSLTALDRETGSELWTTALPWPGDVITAIADAENSE